MHTTKLAASLLVVAALILGATPARAETVNCTPVTALPAVITVQGLHCLTADLTTAMTIGNAIEIQTNNVVLDLNGFKLGGLAAGPGTEAVGIREVGRQNITIKNGTIRGFMRGIQLGDDSAPSQGHVVEDIRADQNTYVGIEVHGSGNIVRNNQVVATGGSTVVGAENAFGIIVVRAGPRVLNNDVINTVAQGTGWGIFFNHVVGGLAVNNRITVADRGIEFDAGTGSTGKYRDNLTFAVTTPFIGGTAVGTND